MARKRKNRNKKWFYIVGGIVAIAVAGGVGFAIWQNSQPKNDSQEAKVEEQKEEKEQPEKTTTTKTEEQNNGEKDEAEKAVEEKKVVQYDGEDPNVAEELSGVVTYAGVVDGKLMIRVNIDQYLGAGRCDLVLMRDGKELYREGANIVGGPSTATCEGFDISTAGLGSGNVKIEIRLNSGGKTGTIRGEANI